MSEELKPCPFCGGEYVGIVYDSDGDVSGGRFICCAHCSTGTPAFGTKQEAIEAWNTRAHPTEQKWQPIETAPKDGQSFYVQAYYKVPFKWKPYHPKSSQYKRGVKGRWQEMNEYGRWDNSNKTPTQWQAESAKGIGHE